MCFLVHRPHYVCNTSGIHLPNGKCIALWSEITRVEGAKLAIEHELDDNLHFLFVHARGSVIKTNSGFDSIDGYVAIVQGLLCHLPGFSPDWQQVVDHRFAQNPRWKKELFVPLYYADKVVVYPLP